ARLDRAARAVVGPGAGARLLRHLLSQHRRPQPRAARLFADAAVADRSRGQPHSARHLDDPLMFYLLSKTMDALLAPLTWTALLGALALILSRRRPRLAMGCGILSLLVLCVFSVDPVANWLWRKLEAPAQATVKKDVTYDAVIVLS